MKEQTNRDEQYTKRDIDIKNRLFASVGEGKGGMT